MIIDIRDYAGIDPTGANSSASAFNQAINDLRALKVGVDYGLPVWGGTLNIPDGVWIIDSLNLTNCGPLMIRGEGNAVLYASDQQSPAPILDMTGANGVRVVDLTLAAQIFPTGAVPAVQPTCGILVAESTEHTSNRNRFENVGTMGTFSHTAVAVIGSTDNQFSFCSYQQDQNGAPALYGGTVNVLGLTSKFATIDPAPANCGDMTFNQCEFHGYRPTDGQNGSCPTSWFYGIDNWRFFGGNHDSSGPCHIRFWGTNRGLHVYGTKIYSESGVPAIDFLRANNSGAYNCVFSIAPHYGDNCWSTIGVFANGEYGSPGDYTGSVIIGASPAYKTGPFMSQFS
jgi:hypothetical protein